MGYMRDSTGRRLDGFEVIGTEDNYDRAPRNISGRGRVGSAQSNGTDTVQTSRLRFVMREAAGAVRLVFTNFYLPSGNNEPSNAYNVTVKASIEDPSNSLGNPGGTILIPVFFNGRREAVMEPGSVLVSDPVLVNVAAGSNLWVRSRPLVASGDKWVNNYTASANAGTNFDGGGGSEGLATSDVTDSGTCTTSTANAFGPAAIVAVTPSAITPATLILGDSIAQETGIITTGNTTYLSRAAINAGLPIIRLAEGGERMQTILSGQFYWKRMQLHRFARHAVVNYGTNDVYSGGRTLAQMKADYLSLWTMLARLGLLVHQATILPRPGASTDGYMSVAGQSITDSGKEAVRTGVNAWLRDTGPTGAQAQSNGALRSVIDACAAVEVNSSGVLTLNGGFWKAAPGGVVKTGTATGYTTTTVADSGAGRTTNADQKLVLAITAATTGAGQAQEVISNTATAWTLLSAITLPTGTVQYQLGHSYNYDGIHPTEEAHDFMGDSLDLAYLATT